jgi:hypothetical protein
MHGAQVAVVSRFAARLMKIVGRDQRPSASRTWFEQIATGQALSVTALKEGSIVGGQHHFPQGARNAGISVLLMVQHIGQAGAWVARVVSLHRKPRDFR